MRMLRFGLYPVVTGDFCKGKNTLQVIKEIIQGGARVIQLREKSMMRGELFELALQVRKLTKDAGVQLIINDYVDIALAVKADGVHLGQKDFPCYAAREIAPDLIIGISTHNQEQIELAEEEGASYVNLGPIFPTNTKETNIEALSPDYIDSVKVNIPFTVMGGIKKTNIHQVLEKGARNIAMVTEVTMADDITATVKELVDIIDSYP